MTSITDMGLPDEVVKAAANAIEDEFMDGAFAKDVLIDFKFPARAAIRAALQAMVDNGMARFAEVAINYQAPRDGDWNAVTYAGSKGDFPAIIIRMDADERKRK